MNEVKIFENKKFGSIRTIMIDDEPWFVGKDVAAALGYSNTRDALAKHVDDEDKNTVAIRDGKGNPNQTIINESGVYSLVFGSKLPEAKEFKHWVTHDVLPSIRKTGAYSVPPTGADEVQALSLISQAISKTVEIIVDMKKDITEVKERQQTVETKLDEAQRYMHPEEGAVKLDVVAREIGAYSETCRPHIQLVAAIARHLGMNTNETRHHDDQYTQTVLLNGGPDWTLFIKPAGMELIKSFAVHSLDDYVYAERYKTSRQGKYEKGDLRYMYVQLPPKGKLKPHQFRITPPSQMIDVPF